MESGRDVVNGSVPPMLDILRLDRVVSGRESGVVEQACDGVVFPVVD